MADIILLNKSKRLHVVDGVGIVPTAAKRVGAHVLQYIGVKNAIAAGELVQTDEERDPILDKEDAEKDSKAKKSGRSEEPQPAPAKKAPPKKETE